MIQTKEIPLPPFTEALHFIVDFYCPKAILVIESDGGQHFNVEGMKKDRIRDKHLRSLGLNVLRFSDDEISKNLDSVLERIHAQL